MRKMLPSGFAQNLEKRNLQQLLISFWGLSSSNLGNSTTPKVPWVIWILFFFPKVNLVDSPSASREVHPSLRGSRSGPADGPAHQGHSWHVKGDTVDDCVCVCMCVRVSAHAHWSHAHALVVMPGVGLWQAGKEHWRGYIKLEVEWGERLQDRLLTGSPGHCLVKAGWGYCFHTSGARDRF